MTVNEVSKISGVSIRTLQYYDKINLLKPIKYTNANYRIYDESSLDRLKQILLLKELEFSLKEIKEILDSPSYDKEEALNKQIELLTIKKEHFEDLINYAKSIKKEGCSIMDFKTFNNEKYDKKAKELWGNTSEYKEYENKSKTWTKEDEEDKGKGLISIFTEFGKVKDLDLNDEKVRALVFKLKDYITDNFYTCSNEILISLGTMYEESPMFKENIDSYGGSETAHFVNSAIKCHLK